MKTEGSTNSTEVVGHLQTRTKTEWGTNSTEVVGQVQTCMKTEESTNSTEFGQSLTDSHENRVGHEQH